ncbi:uncharacterized protein LOC113763447 isoform X3 [Coffea eugenioides]|uniref:uncharacterized protein LOC113763447 isoform X3 n=1 Tax=Coffea eugenioides TaxID=49369 RepID=UPI000F605D27|nr:uncharacterized protein LOC113763447 isoform X3 [Coffea eugenioides]
MESTFNGNDGQTRDLMDGFDVYQSQQWASGNKSELELYLDERLVDRKQQPDLNVLTYWKESRIRYPELSLMARDILSIPITTVASEYALVMVGEFLKNFELLCCWIIWRHYCVLEIGCIIVKEDDEQDLGIDISRLLLNKMHLQMLILSKFCYTTHGGFCFTEDDIFEFSTDVPVYVHLLYHWG